MVLEKKIRVRVWEQGGKKNPKAEHDEFAQVSSLRGQHVWRQWECNEGHLHIIVLACMIQVFN